MRRGKLVGGILTVIAVLAISIFLEQHLHSNPSDSQEIAIQPTSELEWRIHDATDKPLPASGYMLFFQESKKCNGAAVIKYTDEDWALGLAWYDKQTGELTDVIKREELVQTLGQYLEVDPVGLYGIRHAVENKAPEMYVGTIEMSSESVWLQLDPDSCGVRSGWLVYRKLPSGKVTRQQITW